MMGGRREVFPSVGAYSVHVTMYSTKTAILFLMTRVAFGKGLMSLWYWELRISMGLYA